ncbi:hypothetical protein BVC80_9029g25 [Macleaya cordata]|uniref:Uncharacterized protein n=1 Tax=Macleaya cordata TaxID=56857 RepID=A0A200QUP1_MACCD|nr:hypothetical protein BVC80_9029g25 [Macleaya cordata]
MAKSPTSVCPFFFIFLLLAMMIVLSTSEEPVNESPADADGDGTCPNEADFEDPVEDCKDCDAHCLKMGSFSMLNCIKVPSTESSQSTPVAVCCCIKD